MLLNIRIRCNWYAAYNMHMISVTSILRVYKIIIKMCFMFLVLMAFPLQVPVLRREHYGGNYTVLAAFLAETFAGLPFLAIMPLFYTLIG